MAADKRRPATPAREEPKGPAPKDSTQRAPIDTPGGRAPVDIPVSQGPPRPPRPPATDGTQQAPVDTQASQASVDTPLLGPAGEPLAQKAPTGAAAGADPAPPKDTGQADRGSEATKRSQGRSRALHPERIWPD